MSTNTISQISTALHNSNRKITMLADGFIDEVWQIINTRNAENFTTYTQMADFANRILAGNTGGVGMELIRKRRSFGGFCANIGYASANLGVSANLIGLFGDKIDPVFADIAKICDMKSIGNSAVSHVFEFTDGKLLMSHAEILQDLTWNYIAGRAGRENLIESLTNADIIGIGYWSLLPNFDDILQGVCETIPNDGKTRRLFFDFADIKKRDISSLQKTLENLKTINTKFPIILSLNEHEAEFLYNIYDKTLEDNENLIANATECVREILQINELVVHAPTFAVAAINGSAPAFAQSEFCEKPVRTTAAGDTFNGAYIAAHLADLNAKNRLTAANAAVGFLLRNGTFPTIKNIENQLNEWAQGV